MSKTYDEACYDLGVSFLMDHKAIDNNANRVELACLIQEQIEDFIRFKEEQ